MPDQRPPASKVDPRTGGDGWISSMSYGLDPGPDRLPDDGTHNINAITDIGLGGATVDEFCKMLERDLDRPVVNETKLDADLIFK